jgi:hypothetical protein
MVRIAAVDPHHGGEVLKGFGLEFLPVQIGRLRQERGRQEKK